MKKSFGRNMMDKYKHFIPKKYNTPDCTCASCMCGDIKEELEEPIPDRIKMYKLIQTTLKEFDQNEAHIDYDYESIRKRVKELEIKIYDIDTDDLHKSLEIIWLMMHVGLKGTNVTEKFG